MNSTIRLRKRGRIHLITLRLIKFIPVEVISFGRIGIPRRLRFKRVRRNIAIDEFFPHLLISKTDL